MVTIVLTVHVTKIHARARSVSSLCKKKYAKNTSVTSGVAVTILAASKFKLAIPDDTSSKAVKTFNNSQSILR